MDTPHTHTPGRFLCYVLQNTITGRFFDGQAFTASNIEAAAPIEDIAPDSAAALWEACEAIPVHVPHNREAQRENPTPVNVSALAATTPP